MRRRGLIALALIGAGAGTLATLALGRGRDGPVVHVLRHFDTPAGATDPDLTERGQARAEALVRWMAGKPLGAIYASAPKRSRQTVAALSEQRSLPVRLYDPRNTAGLVARVKGEAGPVLVIGHSNTVGDIVAALGGEAPGELAHEDFGDVWTVANGRTARGRVE